MNYIKSTDEDIANETDSDLVNILSFKVVNTNTRLIKILRFLIDFIFKTERFSCQLNWNLDNANNANLWTRS